MSKELTDKEWEQMIDLIQRSVGVAEKANREVKEWRGLMATAMHDMIERQQETIDAIDMKDWHTAMNGALDDLDKLRKLFQANLGTPGRPAVGLFEGERM